jgi:hypothetical protein
VVGDGWWVVAYSTQTGEEFARTYHPSPTTFLTASAENSGWVVGKQKGGG